MHTLDRLQAMSRTDQSSQPTNLNHPLRVNNWTDKSPTYDSTSVTQSELELNASCRGDNCGRVVTTN